MAEVYPARGQVGLGVYPARQLAGSREPRRGPGRVGSGPSGSAALALGGWGDVYLQKVAQRLQAPRQAWMRFLLSRLIVVREARQTAKPAYACAVLTMWANPKGGTVRVWKP
eukprot:1192491-Prorocentrum_minimum.AAC.1